MQSKSKWPTILIVTLTLGLVFGPVFVPREISRWYLAAAHNAFRKKNAVLAEHYLSRAEAWDPSVTKDGDYWVAQLPKFDLRNVEEQLDLLERAVMTDMRWQVEAREAAETLSEQLEFHHAVRALKIASLGQRPTNATDLNQLAYMRALAGVELEDALKDIDRAIAQVGKDPSLLDTKAWVLHSMQRNLEALGYINDAIKALEPDLAKVEAAAAQASKADKPEVDKPEVDKPEVETPKENTSEPDPSKSAEAQAATQSAASTADVSTPDKSLTQAESDSDLDFLEQLPSAQPQRTVRERQMIMRLVQRRLGIKAYTLAVMRYHRMLILEALSERAEAAKDMVNAIRHRTEAAKDRRWLAERGVPLGDELF